MKTMEYIDISNGIELYKLKREITRIEQDFQAYCLTHSGSYELYINSYDPGDTDITHKIFEKGEL